jgi:hypothetical protein
LDEILDPNSVLSISDEFSLRVEFFNRLFTGTNRGAISRSCRRQNNRRRRRFEWRFWTHELLEVSFENKSYYDSQVIKIRWHLVISLFLSTNKCTSVRGLGQAWSFKTSHDISTHHTLGTIILNTLWRICAVDLTPMLDIII